MASPKDDAPKNDAKKAGPVGEGKAGGKVAAVPVAAASEAAPAEAAAPKAVPVKRINVGLQGGGSHGAFTWGVLDRLLADRRIEIDSVTGASAGAMNAIVLAQGMANGSAEEARRTLRHFWEKVASVSAESPLGLMSQLTVPGQWNLKGSPLFIWMDLLSRLVSPYQLNPLNLNPLRDLLRKMVDFKKVRENRYLKVFISATNVETGRAKLFRTEEITVDHLLASACLPSIFQAVEIDGVPYWDGGFMGNPPLWPLFDRSTCNDVVIVQINPFFRKGAPTSAADINDRQTEIVFNSSLMAELRVVDLVGRLVEEGRLRGTAFRHIHVHMIGNEEFLRPLDASSKFNTNRAFLELLFNAGVEAADKWLAENFDSIGRKSTLDVRAIFQGKEEKIDGEKPARSALYHSRPLA